VERSAAPGRDTLEGTVRLFAAESLIFPTGIVTAAFLTRWLGADGYGEFSLAALLVGWVQWGVASLLSRSTILSIGSTPDWKPLATRILRIHLAAGLVTGAILFLAAPLLARTLGLPSLTAYLRLFAIDVPLFVYAHAHKNISTGRGAFGRRAQAVAARWIGRMALIVLLVLVGWSITGAILGSIGASVIELLVARRYDRAPLFARSAASARPFLAAATPLFLSAMAMRFVQDADLFALKALGASSAEAGIYAAARNLSLAVSVFSAAFTPLILSTLVRLVGEGALDHARDMARDALRLVLLMTPFAALAAGASEGIARLVFGDPFAPAGPILSRLIFTGVGVNIVAVGSAILIAGGRLDRPARILGVLAPLVIVGHLWAIPRFGALGAAWVTTGAMGLAAAAILASIARMWGIAPPLASTIRAGAVSLAAAAAVRAWPSSGAELVVRLTLLSAGIPLAILALGEFSRRELRVALGALPGMRRRR
jgi:O-antigen/teichoic acid export membrane protein